MKRLTEEQIKAINNSDKIDRWLSGIFKEPYGVLDTEKRLVIYSRYETGGYSGGSCWGDESVRYSKEIPKDHMAILELVLMELCPNISYLQYREIEKMIIESSKVEYEYYGNSTDWHISYLPLDDLYQYLDTL